MPEGDSNPLVVVLGATGAQGGSVVKYLLGDPDKSFRVRAVTRNVDSARAKDLIAQNVEVVRANPDDLESIINAFNGAYGVFGTMVKETEIQHGKHLVDAAQAAKVKHFVWSTLDHTSNPTVVHWETKAIIDDYLKLSGVPRTSLYTSFYYENFLTFPAFMFKKTEDGKIVAEWPYALTKGFIGGYSVGETGAYVLEALKGHEEWIEWFYVNHDNSVRDLALTKHIYPARKDMYAFVEANKAEFMKIFDS
ncbi:hypothetical protein EW145_g6664 [Phellinidium pouzarii]|uniref:NmrA-like domain-containing protein n=1 Tax=Phellinidium pouzarii TaxID=167371 RepID=A0A4S4KVZ0_9AGAM|nr:hypothetical protein EW145_g6664 [Phellinidium pouzarii]